MSSITIAVAADYRLQQWAQLVKECQNRPSDISIEINGVVIHIKEDISESLLEKIIRVVSRAK